MTSRNIQRLKLPNPTKLHRCSNCKVDVIDKWWIQTGAYIYCADCNKKLTKKTST